MLGKRVRNKRINENTDILAKTHNKLEVCWSLYQHLSVRVLRQNRERHRFIWLISQLTVQILKFLKEWQRQKDRKENFINKDNKQFLGFLFWLKKCQCDLQKPPNESVMNTSMGSNQKPINTVCPPVLKFKHLTWTFCKTWKAYKNS